MEIDEQPLSYESDIKIEEESTDLLEDAKSK